jgi:iron(III) transport system substrate-binding protein
MFNHPGRLAGAMALAVTATVFASGPAAAQFNTDPSVVNVYTTREPGLVLPLFDLFQSETGITVHTVYISQGVAERLIAEGEHSPADIVMMVDYGQLSNLVDRGLTQPVHSDILNEVIPANLRDPNDQWFALSIRARVIYASTDPARVPEETLTYEDLAKPEWRGRVCIRSGHHPYNTSLFAAFIAKHGEQATEDYLRALHANLARTAGGGDRDGARDILAGICDVAVGNSYYVGLMRSGAGGAEQQEWGNAIRVILPTFDDGLGTHVNISGAVVAKYAPHYDNAVQLLEFLVSEEAQKLYADANFEYPVRAGVAPDPIVAAFGQLRQLIRRRRR